MPAVTPPPVKRLRSTTPMRMRTVGVDQRWSCGQCSAHGMDVSSPNVAQELRDTGVIGHGIFDVSLERAPAREAVSTRDGELRFSETRLGSLYAQITKKYAPKKSAKKKSAKKKSAKKARKRTAKKTAKSPRKRSASAREKDPRGGLTAAGRKAFARKQGAHLRPGVTKKDSEMTLQEMRRKGSWAVRFYGRAKLPPLVDARGQPTRHALSAHAWGEPVPKTVAAARRIAWPVPAGDHRGW